MISPQTSNTVLVLHGPNLNMLGQRDPAHYGAMTLDALNQAMTQRAETMGLALRCLQSNHEGALIDTIHQAVGTTCGLIINPAGLTHTSVALADAIELYPSPCIEVHLSNIARREPFRHHSYVSRVASGVISGLGPGGYLLALEALQGLLSTGSPPSTEAGSF